MNREEEIARRLAGEWSLTLGEPLPGATCSLVLAGHDANGDEIVLKAPIEIAEEAKAWPTLQAFSGHGGVRLLKADPETGAVLLPRLRPGATLSEVGLADLAAVDVCADMILRLREAPKVEAMTVEDWFQELDPNADAIAAEAAKVARRLFETTERTVLLHGDFHHGNILSHGDRWVAIDPKGVLGDPAYEITGFMRNPVPAKLDTETLAARIRRFADRLGDPPERLWGWSFAQTVLCAQWCDDDEGFRETWRVAAEGLWGCRAEFWQHT